MKITLSIPQPCDESWDAMLPVSGGRHCESCAKTVVDHSQSTDEELIRFFSRKHSAGSCCRLRMDQLNRPLLAEPARKLRSLMWRRVAAILLTAEFFITDASAQILKRRDQSAHTVAQQSKTSPRYLRGRVTGLRAAWQHGAISVQIGDSATISVTPDQAGHFKIPLPSATVNGKLLCKMQEAGDGYILEKNVVLNEARIAKGLELLWMSPTVLPAAIISQKRAYVPPIIHPVQGGIRAVRTDEISHKLSVYQRIFGASKSKRQ